METLAFAQEELANQIDKLYTNYKKDGPERKTKSYLTNRIQQIKDMYAKFQDTDDKIRKLQDVNLEHPYFKMVTRVVATYNEFIGILRAKLNNGPPLTPVPAHRSANQTEPSSITENWKTTITENTQTMSNTNEDAGLETTNPELLQLIKRQTIRMRNLYRKIDEAEDLVVTGQKQAMKLSLGVMQKLMEQIAQLHEEICMVVTDEEEQRIKYFTEQYFESIDNKCQTIILQITTEIEEAKKIIPTTQTSEIRLPRIQIPIFAGDYQKWTGFRDTFSKLIHENKQISDTHKINYLKGQLEGAAAKLINHLQPTEENYQAAWEILNSRYNNKRLLISTYLNTLLSQANINTESAAALRNLHDTTTECLHGIRNAGVNIESWNSIIIFTLTKKLDNESRRLYEISLDDPREFQSITEFLKFLEGRFKSLEASGNQKPVMIPITASRENKSQIVKRSFLTTTNICVYCRGGHKINECAGFRKLNTSERSQISMLHKLCRNCLSAEHETYGCKLKNQCNICNGRHNTGLHIDSNANMQQISKTYLTTQLGPVILPTALIELSTNEGKRMLFRALIDPGSQASFISTNAVNLLKARKKQVNTRISGLGGKEAGVCSHKVELTLSSRLQSSFKIKFEAMVFKKLTDNIPDIDFDTNKWAHLQHLQLADPQYNKSNSINVIIGVDYYPLILNSNIIRGRPQDPIAQETELGWIIMGSTGDKQEEKMLSMVTTKTIKQQLDLLIENDAIPQEKTNTQEEAIAENLYAETTTRLPDGKYMVHLPFKVEPSMLGESRKKAVARLLQIERKFLKDKPFAKLYHEFMGDYLAQGHMQLVKDEPGDSPTYYIPHHGVINHESTTTKLRVVFDASSKTTSGLSLNDIMMNGPKIQSDLIDIILRWRTHKFVLTADAEKMFRQIWMHNNHQNLQRILWRKNPSQPIEEYKLKTVTYGTTAATFLAVRTLMQLAEDEKNNYPTAAKIMERDFYVDDLLTGGDSIEEVVTIQQQMAKLARSGGFPLHKWASNSAEVMSNIPEHLRAKGMINLKINHIIKTLGILYNPEDDTFEFDLTRLNLSMEEPTKRLLLSDSSKLFDPVGWLSPITITAKLLMQETWRADIQWDDKLPEEIEEKWKKYKSELNELSRIKVPRWVKTTATQNSELHGFADASQQAYAAVVYLRTTNKFGQVTTSLLVSKTRVAPINTKLTVPKLELNAAHLLSRLLVYAKNTMNIREVKLFAWTDSTIVLSWIRADIAKLETFVANRVSQIKDNLPQLQWNYVPTNKNPADLATRGLAASIITSQESIWWTGPTFLKGNSDTWPSTPSHKGPQTQGDHNQDSADYITCLTITAESKANTLHELIDKISNIHKLKRIFVYCQRFINVHVHKQRKQTKEVTVPELKLAEAQIIRIEQQRYFRKELQALINGILLNKKSKLSALNPVISKDGILRLHGRLQNSQLPMNQKQPIILPKESSISKRIIEDAHKTTTLHGGIQLTLANVRNKFWIINGRNLTRHIIQKCVTCVRFKQTTLNQQMGVLPACRVTPSRPFSKVGIDYAGPIQLRNKIGRGQTTYKGYIAVFVCLITKAIHVEVVSGLTTDAFIAAYRRFTSRRGLCTEIYSDNGTNFVGAERVLKQQSKKIATLEPDIARLFQQDETTWHFIPPAAPHCGGIWEAGVKSVKTHMKKVIGETTLTFEEATTMTAQIEACLNSRPLTTLYDHPENLEFLTPAHFLIGGPIKLVPESNDDTCALRTRWHLVQKIVDDFWKRWSRDYLQQLQQRTKWKNRQPNLAVGDVVLMKEEALPPARWKMGRVQEVHTGSDGLVRIVSIRCNQQIYKRPITKLCKLPNEEDNSWSQQITTSNENPDAKLTTSKINNPVRRQPGRQAKGGIKIHLALLALMSVCFTISSAKEPLQIENFKYSTGIYLEKISKMELVAMRWNLVVRYNLNTYWEETTQAYRLIDELATMCNKIHSVIDMERFNCQLVIQQLRSQMSRIREGNQLLMSSNKEVIRTKRGIGDTTGLVLGDMFGILTQREADLYEEHFQTIETNEDHLLLLIKNQTSIIDNSVKLFKHSQNVTVQSINNIQRRLQYLDKSINDTRVTEQQVLTILMTSLELTVATGNLRDVQEALLDVIHNAHLNILHPLLLSPSQLEEQIASIREQIPVSITIPGHGLRKLDHLFKSMTTRTRVTKAYVIIEISIPLSYVWAYNIYSVVAVPNILVSERHAHIVPTTEFIAVDLQNEHFTELTARDISKCNIINDDHLLCEIPTIHTTVREGTYCEVAILQHKSNLQDICEIKYQNVTSNLWIKLYAPNQWVFVMTKETTVTLVCGSVTNRQQVSGSGIIKLDSGCILRDDHVSILASDRFETTIENFGIAPYLKGIHLKELTIEISKQKYEEDELLTTPDTRGLEEQISIMKEAEENTTNEHFHHIHHYTAIHLILWIAVAVAISVMIRHIRRKRRNQAADLPMVCMPPSANTSGNQTTSAGVATRAARCSI